MLLAGLLGALGTLAALHAADHRVEVLVASGDLAPGTVVRAADVRAVRIGADARVLETLVRARDATRVVGRVVVHRVSAGAFLAAADTQARTAGSASRSMSFALDRSRALDGRLAAGDRVDIVALDTRTGTAEYVATNLEVLRVDGASGHGPLGVSDSVTITIAVDADVALRVATALHGHDLTLVRSTGSSVIAADAAQS
jgi:Flp pilus assembly protein CpaB